MTQALLKPFRLGSLSLSNRVVMAPLTRSRADNADNAPTELMAQYYAQRATAGLIISEGTAVSRDAVGFINIPGLFSARQVDGWKSVTAAVRSRGGRMFAQLWHVGSISHPELLDGRLPLAPSAINPHASAYTLEGFKPTVTPREMTLDEIIGTIEDFRKAAENAKAAGFDGIESHAANGYLFHQFFARSTNSRVDIYGGSIENRARFLFDVIGAVSAVFPKDRIDVRINPSLNGNSGVSYDFETIPLFEYVARRLDAEKVGYLHVMEPIGAVEGLPQEFLKSSVAAYFRKVFCGTVIGAVDYDAARANDAIESGNVDLVAFGRLFISNPDLVHRFEVGAPLAMAERATFYSGGPKGYSDYPVHGEQSGSRECGETIGSRSAMVKLAAR